MGVSVDTSAWEVSGVGDYTQDGEGGGGTSIQKMLIY